MKFDNYLLPEPQLSSFTFPLSPPHANLNATVYNSPSPVGSPDSTSTPTTSSLGVAKEEASWGPGNILGNPLLEGLKRGSLKELLQDGESPRQFPHPQQPSWEEG
jgi:hypothetical protein